MSTPTNTPPEVSTVPDSERKGGCSAMPCSQFLAGDFVHHAPSGEDWVLACDEVKGEVMPSGWPMCIAKASDCILQQPATAAQRLEILNTWAARHPDAEGERDWRTITARRQLSTANDQRQATASTQR